MLAVDDQQRVFPCHSASMRSANLAGQILNTLLTLVTNPDAQVPTLMTTNNWARGRSIIGTVLKNQTLRPPNRGERNRRAFDRRFCASAHRIGFSACAGVFPRDSSCRSRNTAAGRHSRFALLGFSSL